MLGFGITLGVIADVVLTSAEGLVKAISDTIHKEFSNVKIAFDIVWVAMAIVLSLIFFGSLQGVREGTIFAAIFTGISVKFWMKLLKKPLENYLNK